MSPTASALRASDELWRDGGGYYTEDPSALMRSPLLPDPSRLRDRRILGLFDRYGGLREGASVLEVGCGRSPWLPFLHRERHVRVAGIDVEPMAAELARANLAGAGAEGTILCRDAFSQKANLDLFASFDLVYSLGVLEHFDDVVERIAVLARFLRPGGRIITLVPNMQGINSALQLLADRETYLMHVVYNPERLRRVHEAAGFVTLGAGYTGFFDGYLSCAVRTRGRLRRRAHAWLSRAAGLGSAAWLRLTREAAAPETRWTSPLVYYAGRREGIRHPAGHGGPS